MANLVIREVDCATVFRWPLDDKVFTPQDDGDDDVLAEGEDSVVSDVARLAEGFLQLFLDSSCRVLKFGWSQVIRETSILRKTNCSLSLKEIYFDFDLLKLLQNWMSLRFFSKWTISCMGSSKIESKWKLCLAFDKLGEFAFTRRSILLSSSEEDILVPEVKSQYVEWIIKDGVSLWLGNGTFEIWSQ